MRQAKRSAMTTTLYDLISALHMHVGLQDDRIVTAIVTYLLRSGQIGFIDKLSTDDERIRHHENRHLKDAFVLPDWQPSQSVSSTDPWEQTQVALELAKGACHVQA